MVNKEELKNVEQEYKKYMFIVKFILLILLFAFLIILVRSIYIYVFMSKVINANLESNLGNNYKLTIIYTNTHSNNTSTTEVVQYRKDNINVLVLSPYWKVYLTPEATYSFAESNSEKLCTINEPSTNNDIDIGFFHYISAIFRNFNIKIHREQLDGKTYIVASNDSKKSWFDSETYILKKEETKNSVTTRIFEKDVVTDEDVKLPNLDEYIIKQN